MLVTYGAWVQQHLIVIVFIVYIVLACLRHWSVANQHCHAMLLSTYTLLTAALAAHAHAMRNISEHWPSALDRRQRLHLQLSPRQSSSVRRWCLLQPVDKGTHAAAGIRSCCHFGNLLWAMCICWTVTLSLMPVMLMYTFGQTMPICGVQQRIGDVTGLETRQQLAEGAQQEQRQVGLPI